MKRTALICLALFPLAVYLGWLWLLCIDIPYADDIDSGLLFAVDWLAAPSSWARLELLFSQQTDHRIILNHLSTIGTMAVTGYVNFRIGGIFGSVLVIAIGVLFWLEVRKLIAPSYASLVAISFVLFQPQAFDSLIWSTASTANNGMVLAGMLALFCISRGVPIVFPICMAFIAAFTQAGGLAIFVVSALCATLRRRWIEMVVWGALCLGVFLLFFENYHRSGVDAAVGTAGSGLGDFIVYFLTWLGLAPGINQPNRALAFGLILLLFSGILAIKRYWNRSLFIWSTIIFLIALGVLNSAARCSFGPEYALTQPRYRFFSTILFAACVIAALDIAHTSRLINSKFISCLSTLAAIVFWTHSTQAYIGSTFDLNRALTFEGIAWNFGNGLPLHPSRWGASRNLRFAVDRGVYRIPDELLERFHASPSQPNCALDSAVIEIEELRETPTTFVAKGYLKDVAFDSSAYILAGERSFLMPQVTRLDRARAMHSFSALHSGFMGYILKSEVPENSKITFAACR